MKMSQEFWVVGGRYRDTSFDALEEGAAELHGPFPSYDQALRSWADRTNLTRTYATVRYSVVVTAAAAHR
jgi:hypothetical protein